MAEEAFGSYRVIGTLGSGGMGVVYLAEHALLGKRAAVKVLRPQFSQDREVVQRFFNEARAATVIKHPGIIEIFDFGYDSTGAAYIVMEFLEGETLASRLKAAGVLAPSLALTIARQVASAMAAAHAKSIVHRDLKPDNIFICPHPETASGMLCKVLDFGIAKLAVPDGTQGQTRTGQMLGTPLYMSPEQCRGIAAIDARADIYSLGCILYHVLSGRPPFLGEGVGDVIGAHIHVSPAPLGSVGPPIAPAIESLVHRMMAKRPEDRPSTMEGVARELDRLVVTTSNQIAVVEPSVVIEGTTPARRDPTPRLPGPAPITTLSSGAAQLGSGAGTTVTAPRRNPLLYGAIAAVALAAIAITAWRVSRGGSASDAGAAAAKPAEKPTDVVVSLGDIPSPGASDVELQVGNDIYPAKELRPANASNAITVIVLVQGTERFMVSEDNYNAIASALDELPAEGAPGSKGALLAFGSTVHTLVPLGPLNNLSGPALGTQESFVGNVVPDLISGIEEAIAEFEQAGVGRRYLLILGSGATARDDPAELEQARKDLAAAEVHVDFVALGDDDDTAQARRLAREHAYVVDSKDAVLPRVRAIVAGVANELFATFPVAHLPSIATNAEVRIHGKDVGTIYLDPSKVDEPFTPEP